MKQSPSPTPTRLDFKVIGLDCAEEASLIKRALSGLAKEDDLVFDYLEGRLRVQDCGAGCTTDAVRSAIAGTGMRAVPWDEHLVQRNAPTPFFATHGRTLLAAASGAAVVVAFAYHALQDGVFAALVASENLEGSYPPFSATLYGVAIALGGMPLLPKAFQAIRHFRPDIHLLVVIAAVGAVALGNLSEAALVVFLFAVSLWLESYSVGRARHAVSALMELTPTTARYRCNCDGEILEKPVAEVPLGATVLLRPGERVPLDGTVSKGESHLDQSPITGESAPIQKGIGDTLYAGSINHEGALEFTSSTAAGDTQLARILHLVEEARAQRAPSEQWVERFARIYTPVVMGLALLVVLAGPVLFAMPWRDSIYSALVLLLIACPCALVISTPVTIFAGLAAAARRGVLIKGGNHLEAIAGISAFAFDKTGTLTVGRSSVRSVEPVHDDDKGEVLTLAAGLATDSQHVHAQAIARYAAEQGATPARMASHTMRPGAGVEGTLDGETIWMGNHRILRAHAGTVAGAREGADASHSIVFVGRGAQLLGTILLADAVRPETATMIAQLQALGAREIVLLTGDNEATARELAESVGISTWRAELLPGEKVEAIQALATRHGGVGMTGDGVNDAPALAAATVGIAMGAIGTDAALETADIALMRDDLTLLPWLVGHSRRTLRILRQNVAIALGLKVAVLILSLTGHAALWLAIAADMGASMLVIGNGLRLLHRSRPR